MIKGNLRHHLYLIIAGFCEIFDGSIKIITLGFFAPFISYRWLHWYTKRHLDREMRKHVNKESPCVF